MPNEVGDWRTAPGISAAPFWIADTNIIVDANITDSGFLSITSAARAGTDRGADDEKPGPSNTPALNYNPIPNVEFVDRFRLQTRGLRTSFHIPCRLEEDAVSISRTFG